MLNVKVTKTKDKMIKIIIRNGRLVSGKKQGRSVILMKNNKTEIMIYLWS